MKLPKELLSVPHASPSDDEILRRVATGRAMLFLGSGYARGAINVNDDKMPTAELLASQLCSLGGLAEDKDLRYVSERVIEEGRGAAVVQHLKRTFAIKEVKSHHVEIARVPWRRVYTTNYDLVFETAARQAGRLVDTVEVSCSPREELKKPDICVHLNGSTEILTEETLNGAFKLSNSSYVAPDSFVTSLWLYPFRQDLERAAAIVFVGYSLYDIEVQKLLFENPEFREKTFFVTAPTIADKERFTLSKFGHVLPIGAEGFAKKLDEDLGAYVEAAEPLYTTAFGRYKAATSLIEIRDADVERFLMHGELSDSQIDSANGRKDSPPLLVNRHEVGEIQRFATDGNNVVATSDFGNGKSVVGKVFASQMAAAGYEVYELLDLEDDYIGDYDKLRASPGVKFLLVDSYTRCIDLLEHHASFGAENIRFVLLARASDHERVKDRLLSFEFSYVEVNLDQLSTDEAEEFVDIVDNVGLWGERAALQRERKISLVMREGRGHISEVLLTIFEAPQMKARLERLLSPVISVPAWRDTIFAISILEFLSLPLHSSLVARAALNDEIFKSSIRNEAGFQGVYAIDGNRIRSKSSIFGLALARNNFSASYIVAQLLKIVGSVTDDRGESRDVRELFKSLLRFSIVERLLPEKNRKDNLVRYYEQLKRTVSWLSSEPHYWVQYAMALLTFNEFDRAQGFLEQAYALAERRNNYHTDNIDTQQARLYLLRCLQETVASEAARYFTLANNVLSRVPNDVGKLRQLERYVDVYRQRYSAFPARSKVEFEHACKAVRDALKVSIARKDLSSARTDWLANNVLESMDGIIDEIRSSRPLAAK